jgi:hypothetical protein
MLSALYRRLSVPHFNVEEVAKALSNMDVNAVQEARRTYNFKYKVCHLSVDELQKKNA